MAEQSTTAPVCPFLRAPCIEARCMFWSEDACLIFSSLQAALDFSEEYSPSNVGRDIIVPVPSATPASPDGIPERGHPAPYLSENTDTDMSDALATFAHANNPYPDSDYLIPLEVSMAFWKAHNVEWYSLPPDQALRRRHIEDLAAQGIARKRFRHIFSTSSDVLAKELHQFATSHGKAHRHPTVISTVAQEFWALKGIPPVIARSLPAELLVLQKDVEFRASELRDNEEAARLPRLLDSCIRWAIAKGLRKLTRADVELFAAENDMIFLPSTARTIYLKANDHLRGH